MRLPGPYQGPANLIGRYWKAYGGWSAMVRSPYLHVSFVFAILSSSVLADIRWTDLVLQVMPNLVGFSLAGYSVLLGFGSEKFKQILAESISDEGHSAFIEFNAAFVSFIAFQIVALAMAIMAKSTPFVFFGKMTGVHIGNYIPSLIPLFGPITKASWFLCYWIFIYALSLAVAATLSIFRLAGLYDRLLSSKPPQTPPQE